MNDEYRDWQDRELKVVCNHDNICSIWPSHRGNAPGWNDVGFIGMKAECLKFIEENCDNDCRLRLPLKYEQSI